MPTAFFVLARYFLQGIQPIKALWAFLFLKTLGLFYL